MRAWTLLFDSASSLSLLQASSGQSGYTSLVNSRFLPSGEKSTPPASVEMRVTGAAAPPSAFMIQTWGEPLRSEMKAMRLESGDQRAHSLDSPALVSGRGVPPSMGTV